MAIVWILLQSFEQQERKASERVAKKDVVAEVRFVAKLFGLKMSGLGERQKLGVTPRFGVVCACVAEA